MKAITKFTIFLSIIIIITLFVIIQKIDKDNDKGKDNKVVRSNSELIVNARKVKFEIKDDKIITSGTFLADESIEIKSEIAGKIEKINFEEGKYVKQGQLLIKLKSDNILSQIKKANEKLTLLELTEKRQKKLLSKEGISQEEYDISLNEMAIQKAELSYLKAMFDKTEIYSPFNGISGFRNLSVGSYVSPNDLISKIFKIDKLKLEFSIPQKYYNLLEVGDDIEFRLPPNDKVFTAKVYALDPEINSITRTLVARAYYSNRDYSVKPGAFAEIVVKTSSNQKKLMIPTQALIPDLESEKVFIYDNGIAKITNVKTGLRTPTEIEIISGLNENDIVITSGIIQLKQGSKVKIKMEGN